MAEPVNGQSSQSSDVDTPLLKLTPKDLLEFVNKHTEADRASFDRLLKWFGLAVSGLAILVAFLGYQTRHDVQATAQAIRDEAKTQIQAEVNKETSQENIQKYIEQAIEKKTEAEFREAIGGAVAAQLGMPERQKALEVAVQHEVDLWFRTHQEALQTAAREQVNALTEHLQRRLHIAQLGDAAVSATSRSGTAYSELERIFTDSPQENERSAARAEIARVRSFWVGVTTYIRQSDRNSFAGGPGPQAKLTTCNLLQILRHSTSWTERAISADLLRSREEQGVVEVLMSVMQNDPYIEVRVHAFDAFALTTNTLGRFDILPDARDVEDWWASEGKNLTAKWKPSGCPAIQ